MIISTDILFNFMLVLRKLFILIFILTSAFAVAQKQANVWYFGEYAGLDFNTGEAIAIAGISVKCDASISDSAGNFLFATNARTIWNKNKMIMQNGEDLIGGGWPTQAAVIVQKPGSNHLYYVFTIKGFQNPPGLYYSVVDMELDDGLGAVIEKNISLDAAWDAVEKLTAVKHSNGKDIWIITRKFNEESYASFLLTSSGINTNAVLSYTPHQPINFSRGQIKISYNKKYLIAAYKNQWLPNNTIYNRFHINHFNASTGEINFMYTISFPYGLDSEDPQSVEFSPDSKWAYLSTWAYTDNGLNEEHHIYQYDMSLIEDSTQFVNSVIMISNTGGAGLQLATDGKIYCSSPNPVRSKFLNIINKPWKKGEDCDFEENAVNLDFDGWGRYTTEYIINILLDYLYRFEWDGHCQSEPFQFQSNFQPV
ncbi:MAG: hypothetical protein GXO86_13125, partial [Chlorobi bacterium]|nr:hypothetical protein [Chlorobiota bacterium]